MRVPAAVRTLLAGLGVAAVVATGIAVSQQKPDLPPPGDKSQGEEEQIKERVKWFIRSRGLDQAQRPDRMRGQAVQELRRARESREFELAAAGEVWESMGPITMTMLNWTMGRVSGRVAALAVHPTNESVVFLGGASGGVWRTTNGGTSWEPVFDATGTQSVGAITVDRTNPSVVWVGTGERQSGCANYFGLGVFRSTDGGTTFAPRNGSGTTAVQLSYVGSIAVHPTNSQTVLVSGEGFCENGTRSAGGVYKTTDGGLTWRRVLSGSGSDVVFDPGNPSVVYAAVGSSGVHKSTNTGDTWTLSSSGMVTGTSLGRLRLAMAPSNSSTLYALSSSSRLYRTTNGAGSWTQQNGSACEGQCSYNLTLDVHPTNANTVLVGSIRFARSTDGGVTLGYLTSGWGSGQKVHQDTHVLRYSRTNGSRFWVGCDGGAWRTDDGGANFVNLNTNINLTQFYDIAIDPNDPTRIFGGAQDNSSLRRSGSQQWNVTRVTGDGFMNLVDPADPNRVFQTSYPSGGRPSLIRSTTGGDPNTFSTLATNGIVSGEPFPWVTPLAVLPGTVFVGSHSVYRASAGQSASSFTWTKISGNLTGATSTALSVISTTPGSNVAYVGTANGRLHRTGNVLASSVTWADVTGNYPGGYVSDIAADPGNTQRVFASRGSFGLSRLYRSTTGGATWTAVGSGLPNVPANAVAIDPVQPSRIFVGTDVGVYESANGGDSFVPFSAGLPLGAVVTDLEVDNSPHVLVAGTYGRGAYRVNLTAGANTAPAASFSWSASGLTVSFTDSSTDSDGVIASRLWNFGDGTSSTATNPTKTYAAAGTYTVGLTVTDDDGASGSTTRSVTVSGGTATNLALNRPATGSTPCNTSEGPEKAFNGSVTGGNTDKWCSLATTKWLQVDLQSARTVGRFVVKHAGAGGESSTYNTRDFNIQTSADNVTWSTAVAVSANTASTTTHTVAARTARYVRLNVTLAQQTSNTAARIYELEVYAP